MKAPFCIWSQFYNTAQPEEAILEFEKDGLNYIELSSEHITALLARSGDLKTIGREFANFCLQHGVKIRQAHIIFPSHFVTERSGADIVVRQIEMLSAMGVKAAVLHCDDMIELANDGLCSAEIIERNIEALRALMPRIEGFGITVCLENLQKRFSSVDELLYIIDSVGSDFLGICLDTGHLNLSQTSTQREFILKAGKRLKALHIADNDGTRDQHRSPFSGGNVDFFEVVDALREIDYDGMFNMEIGGESKNCPVPVKHVKFLGIEASYKYLFGLLPNE
jgi:sugar phosphate isomerase/epimerase